MTEDFDCQVAGCIWIAALARVYAEAVERFEDPAAGVVRVFGVRVQQSYRGYDEPLMGTCACICCIEVSEAQEERQGCPKGGIFQP